MKPADYASWLYGSVARGDADELSDIDVLCVGARQSDVLWQEGEAVSRYTWIEFERLAAAGSLFLHHLRSEGRLLGGTAAGVERAAALLRRLPAYRYYRRDIAGFRHILRDVDGGITAGSTPEYELSVLATVARHGSVLGAYLCGTPCYSRKGAFDRACDGLGLSNEAKELFGRIYAFRMAVEGRCPVPEGGSWDLVHLALPCVRTLVDSLEGAADGFEERMLAAHR